MSCVLISGCNSGLGFETALAFARLGKPVVAGLRNLSKADEHLRVANDERLPIYIQQLDITSRTSIEEATQKAISLHTEIKVLVNNAGIGALGSLEDTPEHVFRQLFETNIFGALNLTKAVLPHMRSAGRGVIVNVGSIQGVVPVPFFPIYGATKAALKSITDSLHYEIEPFGLRAVIIEPGRFRTSFVKNLVSKKIEDSVYGELTQKWLEGWARIPGRDKLASSTQIASAIVNASENEESARHLPIGPDVQNLSERRNELTDSEFEAYLRGITGYSARKAPSR